MLERLRRGGLSRARRYRPAAEMLPLLADPRHRAVFIEMRAFGKAAPRRLSPSLIEGLRSMVPDLRFDFELSVPTLRVLCDGAAALDVRGPLGICLRRSLLRAHFLRRAGLPLEIHFGAKLEPGAERDLLGHAWVTLDGEPWYEDERWRRYQRMLTLPEPS